MGYCSEADFEKKLLLQPLAVQFFGKEKFLNKVLVSEKLLLGKFLTPLAKMEELLDMRRHIISLLLRLVPEYPISLENIRIFAIYGEQHNHC